MYIIGDIHGCYETLMALVDKIPDHEPLYFTGDFIDRGPKSKEVVQWLIDNSSRCTCVTGNHEQMMLNFYDNPTLSNANFWTRNGGYATLASYFPNAKEDSINLDLPKEHLDFFKGLPLFIEIEEENLFISHSSWNGIIPFENILYLKDTQNIYGGLTWHRGTPARLPDNLFHVFGHTIVSTPDITDYYANIDTGAFFARYEEYGSLTALNYPTKKVIQQKNID